MSSKIYSKSSLAKSLSGGIMSKAYFRSTYTHNIGSPLSILRRQVSVRDLSIEDVAFSFLNHN